MELKALKKTGEKKDTKKPVGQKKAEKSRSKRKHTTTGIIAKSISISKKKEEKKEKRADRKDDTAEESSYESASALRRAIAMIADYTIIVLFIAPILYLNLIDSTLLMMPEKTIMYSSMLSLVAIAYASIFMILYQQTFGMMIAKIHVASANSMSEKIGILKYSTLYAGFFAFWIITLLHPAITILAWAIIFAELLSYRMLGQRTMFEMIGNVQLLQERRR